MIAVCVALFVLCALIPLSLWLAESAPPARVLPQCRHRIPFRYKPQHIKGEPTVRIPTAQIGAKS